MLLPGEGKKNLPCKTETFTFTVVSLLLPPSPSLCFLSSPPPHLSRPTSSSDCLEEQKSSAVHLGSNTHSHSSTSQTPVDNSFSLPLSTPTPPAPCQPWSPFKGWEEGSGVSAPERPLSLEHVGDHRSSDVHTAQFHCLGFSHIHCFPGSVWFNF